MSSKTRIIVFLVSWMPGLFLSVSAQTARWKDIAPELLALKDNPYQSGAAALVVFNDGELRLFSRTGVYELEVYRRIKIFTDEGKKYATVSIPYFKGEDIRDIKARVILPDGRGVDMPSTQILTERYFSVGTVKKFTIPGVVKGAIIEYQYLKRSDYISALESWVFGMDDYTLASTFQATIPKEFQYVGKFVNLPNEPEFSRTKWIDGRGTTYAWKVKDLPGVMEEPFSRPRDTLKAGIQFIIRVFQSWKAVAEDCKNIYEYLEKRGGIPEVVASLAGNITDPEEKIARIYDYVQRNIRPIYFYGYHYTGNYSGMILNNRQAEHVDMNVLLCAMLREAGFKVDIALIAPRDGIPFNSEFITAMQFERMATCVTLDASRTVWLDPISTGAPYGILPWAAQGAPALSAVGTDLTTTPSSSFLNSELRTFTVSLSPEGALSGQGTLIAAGENAIHYRRDFAFAREDERQTALLEHLGEQMPGVVVNAFEYTDQITAAKPVEARFSFSVEDYAAITGNRMLVNPALFERVEQDFLPETPRMTPIQMGYVTTWSDEVTIKTPPGYTVEHLPSPVNLKSTFGRFIATWEAVPEGMRYKRSFSITQPDAPASLYSELRELYARISQADQQQIVLIRTGDQVEP